uniref:ADP-ribosylation factor-related protein 1 n=1 Tax=Elaeophora elaphi TaxID=1147741 RepID=A0A0R3RZV4_9BILA
MHHFIVSIIGTIVVDSLRLSFWDLGGQEELQSLWHKYFEDSQALIFVVDSCDPDRFSEVGEAFKLVMNSQAVQKMPVLVVCNKSDIEECIGTEIIRVLTTDDRHVGDLALIPISALQGLNIEHCMRWLCTVLTRNHSSIDLS